MLGLTERPDAFFTPIADHQLPELQGKLGRGVRALCLLDALSMPLTILMAVAVGLVAPVSGVLWALAAAVFFTFLHRVSRQPWGAERPTVLLFGIAVFNGVILTFPPAARYSDASHDLAAAALMLPMVLPAFAPWRPSFTLALGVVVTALCFLGAALQDPLGMTSDRAFVWLVLGVTFTITGAIANQLHRRWWLRLEHTRSILQSAERLYGTSRLTAGMAHELKTPLAATMSALHVSRTLLDELVASIGHPQVTEDDLREIATELQASVEHAEGAADRAAAFVRAVRERTRAPTLCPVETTFFEQFQAAAVMLGHRASAAGIRLVLTNPEDLALHADPQALQQVLTNLMANALDAIEESGVGSMVEVSASQEGRSVVIAVQDDGPGVPVELRQRIFEPLVTTRAARDGIGLGLSLSRDLISAAGGTLRLVDAARGARFEIRLPRSVEPVLQGPSYTPAFAMARL